MNDTSSPLAPVPSEKASPNLESLQQAQDSLRRTLHLTLLLFLVLTGSLFVFFLREVSLARRQITELRQIVMDYEKNSFPLMENFRVKLQAFAQSHPDFNGIYNKYFGAAGAASSALDTNRSASGSNASPARLPPGAGR